MASWTLPYRLEAVDRDPGFCWQDLDDGPTDGSNDFFGQFINFDADMGSSMTNLHGNDPSLPTMSDPLMLDQPSESTASSGVSTTGDEFDFFSSSSQTGPVMSGASIGPQTHEVDPRYLAIGGEDMAGKVPRPSMSDPELPRLEGISLHSPTKRMHISQPSSPTPPSTVTARKPNKFVEALSSTIRRAGKFRRSRKPPVIAVDRPGSPTMENPPMALRMQAYEYGNANAGSPPSPTTIPDHGTFVHGYCDDPFNEIPQPPSATSLHFFHGNGIHTPDESPIVASDPGSYRSDIGTQGDPNNWPLPANPQPQQQQQQERQQMPPQQMHQQQQQVVSAGGPPPESWPGTEYMAHQQGAGWWDLNLLSQNSEYIMDPQQQQQKHANLNMAMHAQHAELPYEYQAGPETGPGGLMIHMPQPRGVPPAVINDISVSGQTYLPPPPPLPPAVPGSDRQHRPPRAPSSGARHLSCSPIRKTRAPSASPQPAHSRHSSGGSIGSTRSASGRGMVPGTPTTIRKQRRSREPSGSSAGGGEIGFVNFTPSDGGMLMTGVAPSGSSKTKARREREAMERRRRLSEAALKAVQAAGGDVDQLMQQGFAL